MRKIILFLLHIYKKTLSPDHGIMKVFYPYGCCKWYPTCSEYAAVAIKEVGALHGSIAASKRLLRCHPWNKGGIDVFSK
jgi:putative membrane protein insertion efficiency factor